MLQFMGLQRVGHDCATELNGTEVTLSMIFCFCSPSYLILPCMSVGLSHLQECLDCGGYDSEDKAKIKTVETT